jgi:hypothetical protein
MTPKGQVMDTLKIIQSNDPDGFDTEPTEAARYEFYAWVESTFGASTLHEYVTSDWDVQLRQGE